MAATFGAVVQWAWGLASGRRPPPRFTFAPDAAEAARLRAEFERDGCVQLRGLLPPEVTAAATEAIEDVKRRLDEIPRFHKFFDVLGDETTLKQMQHLQEHHPFFAELAGPTAVGRLAHALLGEPAVLRDVEYFNKPPGTSTETPPHQDGFYFMIEPERAAVTFWIPLDAADVANGCLVYVCGSSQRGIRPHKTSGVLGFSQRCNDYGTPEDVSNEAPVVAAVGDVVAHDSVMLHRAGRNTTANRQRRAIGLVYFAASAREDVARRDAYLERHRQSLAAMGKA